MVKIYATENPPLSIKNPDESIGGIGRNILNEAVKGANIQVTIEWVPWPRTIESVAKTPNTILFPIGENKPNEERFNLIGKLYSDDVYIYTLKPNKPVTNFKDILNIGVVGMIARSLYIDFAIKYGFDRSLETSYNGKRIIGKLKLKRINAIVFSKSLGNYKFEKWGIAKGQYQKGISIRRIR